jgi:spore germination cell wall hydrolase CwlJ-like protein
MRVRSLLFLLAVALPYQAAPSHATPIGVPAKCLPPVPVHAATGRDDVTPRIHLPRQGLLEPEQRDYLVRTLAFEAANEPDAGKAAVVHVILNRVESKRWGDNVKDVVTQRWQFEPWMTRRSEMERLSEDDPVYRDAARIADAVLAGEIPDPTGGATHFLNPKVVRQRRGGSLPSWASGAGQHIGQHTFYAPYEVTEESLAPRPASFSVGMASGATAC